MFRVCVVLVLVASRSNSTSACELSLRSHSDASLHSLYVIPMDCKNNTFALMYADLCHFAIPPYCTNGIHCCNSSTVIPTSPMDVHHLLSHNHTFIQSSCLR
jgi:hypothetical protein